MNYQTICNATLSTCLVDIERPFSCFHTHIRSHQRIVFRYGPW